MRNPLTLLSDAVALVRQNIPLYLGILLVPLLLSYLAGLFTPPEETGVIDLAEWSVYLGLLLVSVIANVFMTIAFTLALRDPSHTVAGAYRAATTFFWRYLGMSIVMSVLIVIGFLLLIVPGIILSVWFTFAAFVLVLENQSIRGSLRQSREYVRGRWWGVFGRLIVLTLVALVISVLFGVVISLLAMGPAIDELILMIMNLALVPVMMGYMYLMYQDIKGPTGPAFAPNLE